MVQKAWLRVDVWSQSRPGHYVTADVSHHAYHLHFAVFAEAKRLVQVPTCGDFSDPCNEGGLVLEVVAGDDKWQQLVDAMHAVQHPGLLR